MANCQIKVFYSLDFIGAMAVDFGEPSISMAADISPLVAISKPLQLGLTRFNPGQPQLLYQSALGHGTYYLL